MNGWNLIIFYKHRGNHRWETVHTYLHSFPNVSSAYSRVCCTSPNRDHKLSRSLSCESRLQFLRNWFRRCVSGRGQCTVGYLSEFLVSLHRVINERTRCPRVVLMRVHVLPFNYGITTGSESRWQNVSYEHLVCGRVQLFFSRYDLRIFVAREIRFTISYLCVIRSCQNCLISWNYSFIQRSVINVNDKSDRKKMV